MFRTLGVMLWAMGAVITLFYLFNIFNEVKSDIHQQYSYTYDSMVEYVHYTDKTLRSIQYMVDSHIEKLAQDPNYTPVLPKQLNFTYLPLTADADCSKLHETSKSYLVAFNQLFSFWRNNIVPPQGLKTVFIVDDHPINRSLLADQLKSIGFNIVLAEDGLIALDYVRQNNIDIVLTDVNMPNLDGYGLTKLIREEGYAIPIVALTANAMAEEKQRCLSVGMDDCLSKPVTLKKLKQSLLKCCDVSILATQENND